MTDTEPNVHTHEHSHGDTARTHPHLEHAHDKIRQAGLEQHHEHTHA